MVRLPRYQGHSENPFITRNKRYELVERDHLGKRPISHYAVLQVSTIHLIPRNSNLKLKQNSSGCSDYDEQKLEVYHLILRTMQYK